MDRKSRVEYLKSAKPFKVIDIIVIALTLIIVLVLVFTVYAKKGKSVEVSIDGDKKVYDINTDRRIEVQNRLTIVIENGECYVQNSNCPDKVCEEMGRIKNVHQTIACTPQHIIIRVTGQSKINAIT